MEGFQHCNCGMSSQKHFRTLTRPSGKRDSLSHSIDHISLALVDHVPINFPESSFPARLYVFDDNEAVIRMISKVRSSNLRPVSRTHRVDLDRLCERINLPLDLPECEPEKNEKKKMKRNNFSVKLFFFLEK